MWFNILTSWHWSRPVDTTGVSIWGMWWLHGNSCNSCNSVCAGGVCQPMFLTLLHFSLGPVCKQWHLIEGIRILFHLEDEVKRHRDRWEWNMSSRKSASGAEIIARNNKKQAGDDETRCLDVNQLKKEENHYRKRKELRGKQGWGMGPNGNSHADDQRRREER